jgi:glycosyltransferase involved in cell wall biosynthesis
MTRIGVVIPSYNHARFVGDAVRSVLDQTHTRTELVVVDDGSKDDSPAVVRAVLDEYPGRRTTLIVQENRGAHAAITRGFDALDTPVCAVLNSDDLYEPDRFERMLPALEAADHAGLAIAFSGLTLIDDAGAELPPDHPWSRWYATALTAADTEPTIGFALLVHNFSVTSGNFLFTRALYDRLGGFGPQKFVHDWDFLIRAAALTEPVFVPEQLMRYRVHETNTTERVRGLLAEECILALDRYASLLESTEAMNLCAPCRALWPDYWARFGERQPFFTPGSAAAGSRWHARLSQRP